MRAATDFSHPLTDIELKQRREFAAEFAQTRDAIAASRGLAPHDPGFDLGAWLRAVSLESPRRHRPPLR